MHNNRKKGPNFDKPNNFKSAISRLFKELKNYRVLIILAIVLSAAGSILSIFSPNILSDLTDEIQTGLIINKDNMEIVSKEILSNLDENSLKQEIPKIMDYKLNEKVISDIMKDNDIKEEEKEQIGKALTSKDTSIEGMSINVQKYMLSDSEYNGVTITLNDKLELIENTNNGNKNIPNNILKAILKEITIDDTKISVEDQIKFINLMNGTNENSDANEILKKLDEMPESIYNLINPKMNMDRIKTITIILVIMYVVSAILTYIEGISMTVVANKFAKRLRSNISTKINKLPLSFFDKNQKGDILSRVTNDVDTIAQSMNQSIGTLVSAITLLIGSVIMMFVTNGTLAITAIGSSLLGFIFMFIVLSKSQKYFKQKQDGLGKLNSHIEEIYSGLNVVKTYNGIEEANNKFDKLNKALFNANRKSQFLSGLMMPMMSFIGNFGYVAVCIVGALLTLNGKISFGVIIAFISYTRLFTSPLSQIAQAMTSLQSTAAASERVFEILEEKEMDNQKAITKHLDKSKVKGNIEFKNVTFTYDGNKKPTITDFSAKAKYGSKIAIVGPTGAGKTTLVNLLMKFYEIDKGDILIDELSTKNLTRENIHELFTMVLQDTWIFDGTVKENIVYNRENVSDERVKDVCKTVGLDHFIKTLPKSYNTKLSDNDSVSQGQRQLITIARGMIEDAPFLILDEATSNVDTRTEELVQIAMDKLTEGRTSFIIAHRLSTIKNADLILVMKDGNIIESGNHNELMNQKGFYADLYNSQFEL